ncbi:MAG TPA: hypothetical protein ENF67_00305 [Candidatus Pacearchaeota archaeon]|nr:MAG: hypothetical protein B6U82_00480 [Candidatus Pacearchaeota archaeon ex4484_31]HDI02975.1 hypothetical protein [Candidatus Pacearchaeota archaeon]
MGEKKVLETLLDNTLKLHDLLIKFSSELSELNKKLDSLLSIFENASKAIEEKPIEKEIVEKLDKLLEQNKTIAKGILLLEKSLREKGL